MSTGGTWLRDGTAPHRHSFPRWSAVGAVWQCECGRRYTARPSASFNCFRWRRRLWPWPRARRTTPTTAPEAT